jgi:hypothetical protein
MPQKPQSLDDMMAYLDENGNLSSTPPDPKKAKVFKQEDMQIGVPKYEKVEADIIRNGTVTFFDESKGFGLSMINKPVNGFLFISTTYRTNQRK